MMGAGDLAKMVPGFEFLQGLMKGGAAGLPAIGQWVAPTLDPAELEKRINDLRTVQFWLEQNARLIGGTIQALEVQRMTLSTLQTMNLPMADLRNALKIPPRPEPVAPAAREPEPEPAAEPAPPQKQRSSPTATAAPPSSSRAAKGPPAVDPMQWWGALTQQFTEIASKALKDTTSAAAAVAAPMAGTAKAKAKAKASTAAKAKAAAPPARKRKG
jgi:hypothetical protein